LFSHYTSLLTNLLVVMFAHLTSTLHAPSVAHLEEGRTPPALLTGTSTSTVAVPDALAGHPQLNASGQHATNGARTWGVSIGAWSDDEVWMKDPAVCPRTSGYLSAENTKESYRPTDRAQTSDETVKQCPVQHCILRSPEDFSAPLLVYGEQQATAIMDDPVLSVTQNQLMEIVRRACHEVTATPFTDSPVRPKQLSYGSPHAGLECNPQLPAFSQQKSSVRGRSTTVKHATKFPPTRTSVRWRSPSDDKEQFFDARQSLSCSRSRTSASRGRRTTLPNPSATRQSSNPSDDTDDDKNSKKPERRRGQSPSPPPNHSGPTTS